MDVLSSFKVRTAVAAVYAVIVVAFMGCSLVFAYRGIFQGIEFYIQVGDITNGVFEAISFLFLSYNYWAFHMELKRSKLFRTEIMKYKVRNPHLNIPDDLLEPLYDKKTLIKWKLFYICGMSWFMSRAVFHLFF